MLRDLASAFTGNEYNLILDACKIVVKDFEARHTEYNTEVIVSKACFRSAAASVGPDG
jgi:hypothetical protein